MARAIALLSVLGLCAAPAGAQRVGAISGQVVDGVTGKPIAAAIVSIAGTPLASLPPASQPRKILTGADGQFTFTNLEPGVYSVAATKGDYAEGQPGRRRPGGQVRPITLTAARPSAQVSVPMWRFSAIAGTVIDDVGEVVVGMQVKAVATFSDRVSQLDGTVTAGDRPVGGALVVAFSADRNLWFLGSRRVVVGATGRDGRYVIRNLPPASTASPPPRISRRGSGSIPPRWSGSSRRPHP